MTHHAILIGLGVTPTVAMRVIGARQKLSENGTLIPNHHNVPTTVGGPVVSSAIRMRTVDSTNKTEVQ